MCTQRTDDVDDVDNEDQDVTLHCERSHSRARDLYARVDSIRAGCSPDTSGREAFGPVVECLIGDRDQSLARESPASDEGCAIGTGTAVEVDMIGSTEDISAPETDTPTVPWPSSQEMLSGSGVNATEDAIMIDSESASSDPAPSTQSASPDIDLASGGPSHFQPLLSEGQLGTVSEPLVLPVESDGCLQDAWPGQLSNEANCIAPSCELDNSSQLSSAGTTFCTAPTPSSQNLLAQLELLSSELGSQQPHAHAEPSDVPNALVGQILPGHIDQLPEDVAHDNLQGQFDTTSLWLGSMPLPEAGSATSMPTIGDQHQLADPQSFMSWSELSRMVLENSGMLNSVFPAVDQNFDAFLANLQCPPNFDGNVTFGGVPGVPVADSPWPIGRDEDPDHALPDAGLPEPGPTNCDETPAGEEPVEEMDDGAEDTCSGQEDRKRRPKRSGGQVGARAGRAKADPLAGAKNTRRTPKRGKNAKAKPPPDSSIQASKAFAGHLFPQRNPPPTDWTKGRIVSSVLY